MTDSKSPKDRLLELVVFGPAGLAVTVVEEFPRLVEKGRHRVEGQVHTARLVGQFAVQMGRRQVEQTLDRFGARPSTPSRAPAPNASGPSTPRAQDPASGKGSTPTNIGRGAEASPSPSHVPPSYASDFPVVGQAAGNGAGPPAALAIPGYDSLSASQVVQRLEGLSPEELAQVRAHEASNRQRRTILHRVEQLLAGADGAQH